MKRTNTRSRNITHGSIAKCRSASTGFSIGDVVTEINRRVHETLYPEIFCAACLVELDEQRTTATIWNGAMPDVVIVDTVSGQQRYVTSSHQALGVRNDEQFDRRAEIISISETDVIILCSDGFIEARNDRGEKYGQKQFTERAARVRDRTSGLPSLRASFLNFMGSASAADDVSLVEICCVNSAVGPDAEGEKHRKVAPTHWQSQMVFHADALRTVNVVAVVSNLITQVQSPPGHRERIFTVLTELLSNALDHGLLGLDSQLKSSPEGFAGYYLSRSKALAELTEGWLRVTLQHMPDGTAGVLKIRIDDSGPGFDYSRHNGAEPQAINTTLYRSRGIPLVKALCSSVVFGGNGNRVEVVYRWAGT
ncbi:MAG: serine/threonine-protein phosphatase [Gammaproteobacteria bacterium]|nr:serine/threonine-protein phosphatase [Gammaproteobacteria bacterium]